MVLSCAMPWTILVIPTDDKTIQLIHFLPPTEFDLTLLAGRGGLTRWIFRPPSRNSILVGLWSTTMSSGHADSCA